MYRLQQTPKARRGSVEYRIKRPRSQSFKSHLACKAGWLCIRMLETDPFSTHRTGLYPSSLDALQTHLTITNGAERCERLFFAAKLQDERSRRRLWAFYFTLAKRSTRTRRRWWLSKEGLPTLFQSMRWMPYQKGQMRARRSSSAVRATMCAMQARDASLSIYDVNTRTRI